MAIIQPGGSGGSGGAVLTAVTPRAAQIAGNITMAGTGTTSVEIAAATGGPGTGGLDLVIAAVSGDYLLISGSVFFGAGVISGQEVGVDIATIVSSAPVNWIGQSGGAMVGTNAGISGFDIAANGFLSVAFSVPYIVQSGDLSGGNVRLRPYYGSASAHGIIGRSGGSGPLIFGVANLKH